MSFDLEGQRFVITGAGRGIGNAIGKRFACLGARVSGWDLNVSEIIKDPAFEHIMCVYFVNSVYTLFLYDVHV